MKFSKTIVLLFALAIFSCGSDDDGNPVIIIPQGEDITPTSSIDVEAVIALPPDSDITNLVTFGNDPSVSAADYLTEVELLDTFNLVSPQMGLAPGDEFFFSDVIILNEFDEPIEADPSTYILDGGYLQLVLPEGETGTVQDYYEQSMIPAVTFNVINAEESEDIEWKYDIECYIRRGGTDYGPYIIDPKLRLKRRN